MPRRPAFWTYLTVTGLAVCAALVLNTLLHITGRLDVAVTLAMVAAAVYAITPADQRDQAKRLFGMVFLALSGLVFGSGAGALFGMLIAAQQILGADGEAGRVAATGLVPASSMLVAGAVYAGIFSLGWPLVKPLEPEPLEPTPRRPFRAFP